MNAPQVYPGIRFNDYFFSEPEQLRGWIAPRCAGIFVILVADGHWAPKPYQPVLFGEFGNNAREMLTPNEKIQLLSTFRQEVFFVAMLPMPFSTTAQRAAACQQLVSAYNPVCQAAAGMVGDLAGKLEQLEKKHEEQSTYMRLLLANAGKLLEAGPPAEKPRRQVGFVAPPPQAEPTGFEKYCY